MNPILEEDEEDRDDPVVRGSVTSESLSQDWSQSDPYESVGDLYVSDKSEGVLEVFPVLVRKISNPVTVPKEEESESEEESELLDLYNPEIMTQVLHRVDLSALDRVFLAIFEKRKLEKYHDTKAQEIAVLELALNTLKSLREEDSRPPS